MYGKKSVPMKPYYILQNHPTTCNVEAFLGGLLLHATKIWHFFLNLGGMQ